MNYVLTFVFNIKKCFILCSFIFVVTNIFVGQWKYCLGKYKSVPGLFSPERVGRISEPAPGAFFFCPGVRSDGWSERGSHVSGKPQECWFKSGSRCYHSNQRPGLMSLCVDFTLFTCLRQNQEKKDATLNIVPPFPLIACTIHLLYLCSVLSLYLRRYTSLPCPRCGASAAEVTELV